MAEADHSGKRRPFARRGQRARPAAVESDTGGFTPRGFSTNGGERTREILAAVAITTLAYAIADLEERLPRSPQGRDR